MSAMCLIRARRRGAALCPRKATGENILLLMWVKLRQIALINIAYSKWYSLISDQSQGQLSAARAAQLAAQRTELPVLAQVGNLG